MVTCTTHIHIVYELQIGWLQFGKTLFTKFTKLSPSRYTLLNQILQMLLVYCDVQAYPALLCKWKLIKCPRKPSITLLYEAKCILYYVGYDNTHTWYSNMVSFILLWQGNQLLTITHYYVSSQPKCLCKLWFRAHL